MNRHPGETVVTLRPLLPLLRPGGALILTLVRRACADAGCGGVGREVRSVPKNTSRGLLHAAHAASSLHLPPASLPPPPPQKFHGRSTGRDVTWERTLEEQLGPDFRVQLLWLLANTQYEQTCIAFKDPLSGPVAAAATEIAALTLAAAAAPAMGVPPGVAVAAT